MLHGTTQTPGKSSLSEKLRENRLNQVQRKVVCGHLISSSDTLEI